MSEEEDRVALRRLNPIPITGDQIDQPVDSLGGFDAFVNDFLAAVEGDFVWTDTDVAVVGIRHFAGTVDDAAHDSNFDAFEVLGALADPCGRFLQVKQRSSTAWTTDIFRLGDAQATCLKNAEGCAIREQIPRTHHHAIRKAIDELGPADAC